MIPNAHKLLYIKPLISNLTEQCHQSTNNNK